MARIIGLTGGIASGKSTVARMLSELGAPVVDADAIARAVVLPGTPAFGEITARFGPSVIGDDGHLDRQALGAIVFGDPQARADLNRITHPRIAAASQQRIEEFARGGAELVFYEAALLVENRVHESLDALVVVSLPLEVQLRRLMERDELTLAQARARIDAQLALDAKIAVADHVIDNSGTLEDTRNQVAGLWRRLRQQARASKGRQ